MSEQVLEHGYHRFMIYCVVCHDPLGTGQGKIVERGYTAPPSYHIERLRNVPVGYLFAVISEGYGSMPSYSAQIPVRDRWAIAGYLRALQASQHFPEAKLSDEMHHEMTMTLARSASEGPNTFPRLRLGLVSHAANEPFLAARSIPGTLRAPSTADGTRSVPATLAGGGSP
jgi:hypothetical protein